LILVKLLVPVHKSDKLDVLANKALRLQGQHMHREHECIVGNCCGLQL